MRFRGKSIRRKIVALLLVPLVSLIAIWAFAAVITANGVFGLMHVKPITYKVEYPASDTLDALAAERQAVLVDLADHANPRYASALRAAELRTDKRLATMRADSEEPGVRGELDARSRARLDALLERAGGLGDLRRRVASGTISCAAAFTAYSGTIDPYYDFFLGLVPVQSVGLDRQNRVLTELVRAREAITRETALYTAAQVHGTMSRTDQRSFSDAVSQQRMIYGTYPALLPGAYSRPIEAYWKSDKAARALHDDEERILDADPGQAAVQITPAAWQSTASTVLANLDTLDRHAADGYMRQVEPYAGRVLIKAGIAAGFGLVAVVVSIVVSLRVGSGLARSLSRLRKEAQEASGTRLPRVMRRLAAGEEVDIETEVPRLDHGDDEIGAVGKALDTLQRAAVEAAVRQADMRRGVSDVFVNLARRNQVLLHRQLTLLDSMERRTEDAGELADLFRLDHMTTRMRRHAEGLVILSGAAPSRQWRRPVPLMDVVRAAVAEVEGYERVEVRRLPRLAVVGPAVADLTHLVAELVENATVFSPPHTSVQVHGERVANGYSLQIDDRGLGMPPEVLLDANLRLAETPQFDLSDTDRLGLFVVSRLAQRHGVRVSLRTSPYGGITAVVLVPTSLLDDAVGEESPSTGERVRPAARLIGDEHQGAGALPDEIEVPVSVDAADQALRDWSMVATASAAGQDLAETGGRRRGARPGRRPAPTERRQRTEGSPDDTRHESATGTREATERDDRPRRPVTAPGDEDLAPLPRRTRTSPLAGGPARHEAARDAESGTLPRRVRGATRGPLPGEDTRDADEAPSGRALPRRVRQANLAPQLREEAAGASAARPAKSPGDEDRDMEELRARMASLQRGWQRGRAEADGSQPGTADGTDRTTTTDNVGGSGGDATRTTSEGDGR